MPDEKDQEFNVIRTKHFLSSDALFLFYIADVHHYICSKFHFVDLAGSERAHRTGNIGDRFKGNVNRQLLSVKQQTILLHMLQLLNTGMFSGLSVYHPS